MVLKNGYVFVGVIPPLISDIVLNPAKCCLKEEIDKLTEASLQYIHIFTPKRNYIYRA
jgi:hypothetical protein